MPQSTRSHVTLGPAVHGRGFRVQVVDYAPGYRCPPHAHEATGITLVVAGGFRETAHGREEESSPLSVVVKPAGTVHADVAGPRGARTVLVELDDARRFLPDGATLGPWRWLHAGPGVRPLMRLGRALAVGADEAAPGDDPGETLLELLGELSDVPAPEPGDAPAWVRRAREALDDLAPEGLRVNDLAAGLRVHPVSLTRAFRRAYGVPVTTYRRRVRLRRAAERVVGTDETLTGVAHSSGFADQAHMCREVRGATGVTPSALRRIARA